MLKLLRFVLHAALLTQRGVFMPGRAKLALSVPAASVDQLLSTHIPLQHLRHRDAAVFVLVQLKDRDQDAGARGDGVV